MSSIGTAVKRETATQAWSLWITSVTGQSPIIEREPNGVNIKWHPGQAKKMENYLNDSMSSKEPDPNAMNVSVDLKPVLIPLLLKKTIGWVTIYTVSIIILTKILWK